MGSRKVLARQRAARAGVVSFVRASQSLNSAVRSRLPCTTCRISTTSSGPMLSRVKTYLTNHSQNGKVKSWRDRKGGRGLLELFLRPLLLPLAFLFGFLFEDRFLGNRKDLAEGPVQPFGWRSTFWQVDGRWQLHTRPSYAFFRKTSEGCPVICRSAMMGT